MKKVVLLIVFVSFCLAVSSAVCCGYDVITQRECKITWEDTQTGLEYSSFGWFIEESIEFYIEKARKNFKNARSIRKGECRQIQVYTVPG